MGWRLRRGTIVRSCSGFFGRGFFGRGFFGRGFCFFFSSHDRLVGLRFRTSFVGRRLVLDDRRRIF